MFGFFSSIFGSPQSSRQPVRDPLSLHRGMTAEIHNMWGVAKNSLFRRIRIDNVDHSKQNIRVTYLDQDQYEPDVKSETWSFADLGLLGDNTPRHCIIAD